MDLWRLFDPNPAAKPGCFLISNEDEISCFREAHSFNAEGWGIFKTVNDFEGARKIENLKKLKAWYVECDGEDKPRILKKLKSGLTPSKIVESKRGYHAYWNAKDARAENYRDILEYRLIPHYEGDMKAKDIARILRHEDFFHCKDLKNKFFVKKVFESEASYSEKEISFFYKSKKQKDLEEKQKVREEFKGLKIGSDLFENIYAMNCEKALERISGTPAVQGEVFSFKRTSGDKLNIVVNGKSTSCWLDRNRRIGSVDRGGPTIWQWINWYQRDHKRTRRYMKEYFPEVFHES